MSSHAALKRDSQDFAKVQNVDPLEVLTDATRQQIDHWLTKFPADRKRSALLAALRIVQEQNQGFLDDRVITAVARYLDLPPTWAYEVATFYSMYHVGQCGRHKVSICTNISCWLRGADQLVEHVEGKLGIKLGESTPDGRIHLVAEEECLAGCVRAPMMLVDGHYHENLTPESVDQILASLD
ncbi:MAG: NADH-quinone oxidoreductase subunit NuoE [Xanthomonadales bacterium]|nr:NADH-quinone oxidoreductase subunit NuoE [Xanthomonadales bacterium]